MFVLVVGLSIAGMRCSVRVLPELVRGGESRFAVEKERWRHGSRKL